MAPYLKVIFYHKYKLFTEPHLPTLLVLTGWCVISMILGGMLTFYLKKLVHMESISRPSCIKEEFPVSQLIDVIII